MLEAISAFERGALRLDKLVIDLEGLVNALDAVEPRWKQEFLGHWGVLEDARAFALLKGINTFDAELTQLLRSAASKLKMMVIEKIDDPADHQVLSSSQKLPFIRTEGPFRQTFWLGSSGSWRRLVVF